MQVAEAHGDCAVEWTLLLPLPLPFLLPLLLLLLLTLLLLLPLSLYRADLDPIYYCELLRLCPIKDDGDAHILSFTVKPRNVVYGNTYKLYSCRS